MSQMLDSSKFTQVMFGESFLMILHIYNDSVDGSPLRLAGMTGFVSAMLDPSSRDFVNTIAQHSSSAFIQQLFFAPSLPLPPSAYITVDCKQYLRMIDGSLVALDYRSTILVCISMMSHRSLLYATDTTIKLFKVSLEIF